jgi:hypothetical protein
MSLILRLWVDILGYFWVADVAMGIVVFVIIIIIIIIIRIFNHYHRSSSGCPVLQLSYVDIALF